MNQARIVTALITVLVLAACSAGNEPDRARSAEAEWRLVVSAAGDSEIAAIKAVREVTGLGLKEAKDIVDNAPSVVLSGVSNIEAETAATKLRDAGMTVQVERE